MDAIRGILPDGFRLSGSGDYWTIEGTAGYIASRGKTPDGAYLRLLETLGREKLREAQGGVGRPAWWPLSPAVEIVI